MCRFQVQIPKEQHKLHFTAIPAKFPSQLCILSLFPEFIKNMCQIFSKHRPSGPMLSISRNVRLSVCPCVCLCVCSLLRYRLNVFLPPLPAVGCPIFLEIRNPWGKSNGNKWSQIKTFLFENCLKSPRKKKVFFFTFFGLFLVFGLF